MKHKIINLTGHDIIIYKGAEKIVIPEEQGTRLELEQTSELVGEIYGLPLYEYKSTINEYLLKSLAPKKKGVIYIVSIVVAQYILRDDFYIIANPIKTKDGKIIGCRGIAKNPYLYLNK